MRFDVFSLSFRRRILDGKVLGLPRAKEMKEMSWDDELEKEATRYCFFLKKMLYFVQKQYACPSN